MQKVIWTQAIQSSMPNLMGINGEICEYTGTFEQQTAMGLLIEVRSWPCLPVISEQREKFSKGFHVATDKEKGITIRSFYDGDGVRLAYTYYSTSLSIENVINELREYSLKIGRVLNESDFSVLLSELPLFSSNNTNFKNEKIKQIGGGYEKIWQYIRRH